MNITHDYTKNFRAMQGIAFTCICLLACGAIGFFYIYTQEVAKREQSIYVVTDQGTMSAYLTSERKVSIFEAQMHSTLFINAMFAHDKDTYEKHVSDALHLADENTGKQIVEQFDKGQVMKNYIKWGTRTEVTIDSIKQVNRGIIPKYRAHFKQQHFIGSKFKTELGIAFEFSLMKTYRSDQNQHGLLVTDIEFLPYHSEEPENETTK